jgi:hypothetical protein
MELQRQHKPQTTTEQHFLAWWREGEPNQAPVAAVLTGLAQMMGKDLSGALEGYEAILAGMTKDQVILACSLAAEECEFFPTPAVLRRLAKIPTSGQIDRDEAIATLTQVLTLMRGSHGWTLQEIGGRFVDRDAKGNLLDTAYRTAPTPAPKFSAQTEAAIVDVGLGERADGLRALSLILAGPDSAEGGTWHAGEVRRLEQRWFEAYGRAKDAVKP